MEILIEIRFKGDLYSITVLNVNFFIKSRRQEPYRASAKKEKNKTNTDIRIYKITKTAI